MEKNSDFNLVQILNQRSRGQLKESRIREMETEGKSDTKQASGKQIMMIDVNDLLPSKENFYLVDDKLKQSIEVAGVLQPLLVNRPENGKYKVLAGHRRRLAVLALLEEGKEERRYMPCVYKEDDVADRLAIIMANGFRNKTDWERMMEVVEAEKLTRELKKEHNLAGKTRELLAQITGVSETQIGRYKAIYSNLDKGLMKKFKEGVLGFSVVSELCGLPREWQRKGEELLRANGTITLPDIKELKSRKEKEEAAKIPFPIRQSVVPESKMCIEINEKGERKPEEKSREAAQNSRKGEAERELLSDEEMDKKEDESLSAIAYGSIRGYVVRADKACHRLVYVCPTEHHHEEGEKEPYITYGCPVCELLGNRHFVVQGIKNCPLCGVNLSWGSGESIRICSH
ncbi:MAG: ParB N-terminal domain-containing protein [Hungatella sp.]|nr:ParB N-terminal domain-containing protein [Hungatella sp.]